MTRREFFEARAKADYLKRQGAIQCPPAAADGSAPVTPWRPHVRSKHLSNARQMLRPTRTGTKNVFVTFTSPIRKP